MPEIEPPKKREAWEPPAYKNVEIAAVQALSIGKANEHQQKLALDWIINKACLTYDISYRTGPYGDRDTAVAEGRRIVGNAIIKMLSLNIAAFTKEKKPTEQHD